MIMVQDEFFSCDEASPEKDFKTVCKHMIFDKILDYKELHKILVDSYWELMVTDGRCKKHDN
jgi:hypothetical protein